ncbi:MAG: amidase, partial [Betaproteobacteria bacterium]|nr:amidase [Betaproteobacteria bacterium]
MKADEFSANCKPWLSTVGAFSEGTDSPLAFLDRCLRNIEEREDDVRAFACLALDSARAAAAASTQRWREGTPLSILDGIPIGIKDIIETIDLPTGNGSPLFAGWRSGRDAASVKALREAGAVILGKTVTTEFAATSPGETRNPWDLTRTPGGSSSGSAAGVAAGFFSAALGSQVVGSILRPASYCGCYGYKPSVGAINRGGSFDYMSQSCTGVIAASLEDCWQMAFEIVQRAGGDPGFPGLVGPAQAPEPVLPSDLILLQTAGWKLASPQAKAALETALLQLTRAGVRILSRASHAAVDRLESLILEAVPLTRSINTWESRWPLNTYRDRGAGGLSAPMLQ